MKTGIAALVLLMLAITSCTGPDGELKTRRRTPKALEGKVSSVEILSKRASDDLLNALYNELADETPELKALEDGIDELQKSKPDSLAAFTGFNNRNESYYTLSNKYSLQVKDSVLRLQLQQLLQKSFQQYHDTTALHNELLKGIESRLGNLNDLHIALKIVRTLPLIEQYQKENLPATASLQNISNKLDSLKGYADSLLVFPK